IQLRKMQTIKKQQALLETSSNVDEMIVLNEVSEDLTTWEDPLLNEGSLRKNKSSARWRKYENIDAVSWEKRRKITKLPKYLVRELTVLRKENSALKAELFLLKLKFGLISSIAYAQIQKLSNSTAVFFQEYPSSKSNISSFVDEYECSVVASSCISVIKHSPQNSLSDISEVSSVELTQESPVQNSCRSPEDKFQIMKPEPVELENYSREPRDDRGSDPTSIYQNYTGNSFPGYSHSPPPLQVNCSSSNSPRTLETDDAMVRKLPDGQVPKGPVHSPVELESGHATMAEIPEVNSSALPPKLLIKAKAMQIKAEALLSEFDAMQKLFSPINMILKRCFELEKHKAPNMAHSGLTLSLCSSDWILKSEHWHQKQLSGKTQNSFKSEVVGIKDSVYKASGLEVLYLKQGYQICSVNVTSLNKGSVATQNFCATALD
uniref:Vertebrate interleukin-3 regulated transcription factor domain-containing protein n=1 Tax=Loxodonta africana TaxID=9785 RepID=G3UDK4_LOXAF